jgi:hypothetical protein
MLERAERLDPTNNVYATQHKSFARQLSAVHAEQERDKRERAGDSANGGDGWSECPSTPSWQEPSSGEPNGGSWRSDDDSNAYDDDSENVDDGGAGGRDSRRAFLDLWRTVRRTVTSLFLTAPMWASGLGEWALSWLPRDEERSHRLAYLGYFWLGRLELPLIVLVLGGGLRACFLFPWTLFVLGCVAVCPVLYSVGRAMQLRRRVISVPLCVHLLFVYSCPYASAYLYGLLLFLAAAAVFRTIALVTAAVLLFVWWYSWTALYLVLLAGWGLLTFATPIPTLVGTAVCVLGWYFPLSLLLFLSLCCAGAFAYDRSLWALPIAGGGILLFARPWYALCLGACLALVAAAYWCSRLRANVGTRWRWLWGAEDEQQAQRPRDGDAAGASRRRPSPLRVSTQRALPRRRPGRGRCCAHIPPPHASPSPRAGLWRRTPAPLPRIWGWAHGTVAHVLQAKTHYEVLAITQSAGLAQVKSGYKRMALLLHPDKNQRARRRRRSAPLAPARPPRARSSSIRERW